MRWLNTLFWKIFLTIWLVSALGMAGVFLIVANSNDEDRWRHLIKSQFKHQALELIELYEDSQKNIEAKSYGNLLDNPLQDSPAWVLPRNRFERQDFAVLDHRRDRRPPVWLYEMDVEHKRLGTQITGHRRPPPRDSFTIKLKSESGRQYRLLTDIPLPLKHKERFTGYLFSIQMVLILAVAALSALILSVVLVRPIRQLSEYVKQIYRHGDLSARASAKLSQRKDEIGDLTREFDQMADYVESTLKNQQRLLQDVSHELRAPMARLQVSAGLAEQQLGEGSSLAQRINRECERLDGLIAEILSYSRLESAHKEGDRFSVKGLFDELVSDLRFSQPDRPVQIQIEPETLHLTLNRDLLARALRNGIGNALKYTPEDSLLELSAHQERGRLLIRLRDHGDGIGDDLLKELFTPFVRGSGGHGDGYGLGMSIARRAIERLGGRLEAENHPEGGLQLSIRLRG
ncbi:sensor histidine kinase [Oceanospirillum sp.]|uniref:sensor histidine kinase n=1 Tax=Oceanospirillum sp. TaxID=2021254 RepID=UPI003A94C8C5